MPLTNDFQSLPETLLPFQKAREAGIFDESCTSTVLFSGINKQDIGKVLLMEADKVNSRACDRDELPPGSTSA